MMFPRCLPTVALFALALLSQGCGKEGTEQGAVSVTEDPRAAALAAERGRALIDQPGSSSDRRILELAIEAFEEAVAIEPANGDYRFNLAQAYEMLDRIPESLEAYEAYLNHARADDDRAEIVRRQLGLAKQALAAERARETQSF